MSSRPAPNCRLTPHGESTFEHVVRHLRISPEEYASSHALKEWVRRNKDQKYVPSYLLVAWHFEVDDDLLGKAAKPAKRAA